MFFIPALYGCSFEIESIRSEMLDMSNAKKKKKKVNLPFGENDDILKNEMRANRCFHITIIMIVIST